METSQVDVEGEDFSFPSEFQVAEPSSQEDLLYEALENKLKAAVQVKSIQRSHPVAAFAIHQANSEVDARTALASAPPKLTLRLPPPSSSAASWWRPAFLPSECGVGELNDSIRTMYQLPTSSSLSFLLQFVPIDHVDSIVSDLSEPNQKEIPLGELHTSGSTPANTGAPTKQSFFIAPPPAFLDATVSDSARAFLSSMNVPPPFTVTNNSNADQTQSVIPESNEKQVNSRDNVAMVSLSNHGINQGSHKEGSDDDDDEWSSLAAESSSHQRQSLGILKIPSAKHLSSSFHHHQSSQSSSTMSKGMSGQLMSRGWTEVLEVVGKGRKVYKDHEVWEWKTVLRQQVIGIKSETKLNRDEIRHGDNVGDSEDNIMLLDKSQREYRLGKRTGNVMGGDKSMNSDELYGVRVVFWLDEDDNTPENPKFSESLNTQSTPMKTGPSGGSERKAIESVNSVDKGEKKGEGDINLPRDDWSESMHKQLTDIPAIEGISGDTCQEESGNSNVVVNTKDKKTKKKVIESRLLGDLGQDLSDNNDDGGDDNDADEGTGDKGEGIEDEEPYPMNEEEEEEEEGDLSVKSNRSAKAVMNSIMSINETVDDDEKTKGGVSEGQGKGEGTNGDNIIGYAQWLVSLALGSTDNSTSVTTTNPNKPMEGRGGKET